MDTLRHRVMSTRTVICTGNPDAPYSIASGVKKLYPNATFIHKSNGYDLTDESQYDTISALFKKHNTFINASYVSPYTQTKLLELYNRSVKFADVFNIGSAYEYMDGGDDVYRQSKLNLREVSLNLNTFRFKTCHVIVGGIKQSDAEEFSKWLDVDEICQVIDWVTNQRFGVPIISMEQPKKSW